MNVTEYNAWTIFPRSINPTPPRPAHEDNFIARAADYNFRGSRLDGISRFDDLDSGINFFIEGATAYRANVRQAAQLDNFIHVANSLRQPRWRSPRKSLRVQSDDGRNNLRRADKLTAGVVNLVVKLTDVHGFALAINRCHRKTFIAAKKNRRAFARISNDDDDSN